MIADAELAEWERLENEATAAPWIVAHDAMKQAALVDSQRRVIIDGDHFAGDLAFCAAAREAMPRLRQALAEANIERLATVHRMERMEQDHACDRMADANRALLKVEALERQLAMVTHEVQQLRPMAARMIEHEAELAQAGPLICAVRAWHKHRYAPRLVTAWEHYTNGTWEDANG